MGPMPDTLVIENAREGFEEQAIPATRVRGYWQSVFLSAAARSGYVGLYRNRIIDRIDGDLRAADRAVRSVQGKHRRPAEALRLARPSARHRRIGPRHAVPADL